ncbi:MAG: hypothetical protein AAGJ80_17535, partial [Cyanobacteria bacterium J06553_1]
KKLLENQRKYFEGKIANLEGKHEEFREFLSFTQLEFDDLKEKLGGKNNDSNGCADKLMQIQQENEKLQQQLQDMARRLDYQDDQGRRINIRVSGITELPNESWEQTQHKVSCVLQTQLNVTPVLERAHRVGRRPDDGKPRDIITRFKHQAERDAVFRNRRMMKGTDVFINEDHCPGTVEARRLQMPKYYEARKQTKYAFFNYRTLIIRDMRPATTPQRMQHGDIPRKHAPSQTANSSTPARQSTASRQNVPPSTHTTSETDASVIVPPTTHPISETDASVIVPPSTHPTSETDASVTVPPSTHPTSETYASVTVPPSTHPTSETDETDKMTLRSNYSS